MNPFSLLSVTAAGLSLVLAVWLFVGSFATRSLQSKAQDQQQELLNHQQELSTAQQKIQIQNQQIQSGKYLAEQVGPAVLKDLAGISIQKKNEKIRGLLAKYGVSVQESTPAPGAATPAATPASRP
jgi:hypothetical protein